MRPTSASGTAAAGGVLWYPARAARKAQPTFAIGTAASGVLLQVFLDASLPTIEAYQNTFLVFAAFPLLGIAVGSSLRE